jgi:hypothetical protein
MGTYTVDQIVGKYVDLRDQRDKILEKQKEELKPYLDKMELCEQWLLDFLIRTGQESAKTELGTAYKVTATSATVDTDGGWEKFISFAFGTAINRALDAAENGADPAGAVKAALSSSTLDFFEHRVAKSAVKEYMENTGGKIPPGINFTTFTKCNVRRG